MKGIKSIQKLSNGVKVYDLSKIVEDDYREAQNIMDNGKYTESVYVESAYNHRIDNDFVGVYECIVDSIHEYNAFMDRLMLYNLDAFPSFEEWKNNRIEIDGKAIRLGKWLKRKGISDTDIDYYSKQVRTGQHKYYLTISDLPQHIVGMTYYSNVFTSCMHPDRTESIHLAGALHDDTLLVAYLHKDMNDIEDMDNKLLARCNMRIVEYNGTQLLIPSRIYGNDRTQEIMNRCLSQLYDVNIMSYDIRCDDLDDDNDVMVLRQRTNGYYKHRINDHKHLNEDIKKEIEIECPYCNGNKKTNVWIEEAERDVEVKCPVCDGEGITETLFRCDLDEMIEIDTVIDIGTYNDDYEHFGEYVEIKVKREKLKEHMERV